MRTPIQQFAKDEKVSVRFLYKEAAASRLVLTKVGSRTFIDDEDAERWRALAPKVGQAGELVLQAARQAVENLGRAVERGLVERRVAATAMRDVALTTGLNRAATA